MSVQEVATGEALYHYSHKPLKSVRAEKQKPEEYFKPRGLWLSVGDHWAQWCERESFGGDWSHVYRVELASGANVLRMHSAYELDDFTRDFGCQPYGGGSVYIRWAEVAERYDGVLIYPYCWERRMDLMWYYGWDAASGCIWHPRAVSGYTPVPFDAVIPYEDGEE